MADIRKQLECPICKELMFPPIKVCEKGDAICENCRKKNQKCPLCSAIFTEKLDDLLEALAKLPCFVCNKCSSQMRLADMKEHGRTCSLPPTISCPIEKCDWKGTSAEIVNHWRNKKIPLRPFVEDNTSKFKLNTNYFANILEAHDSMFLFKSRRIGDKYFWALQYIGDTKKAKEYTYEIEIFNAKQLENKFILSRYCQSIELANADLFNESTCIFTPKDFLQPYLITEDTILYNLKVRKVDKKYSDMQIKRIQKLLKKYEIK